MKSKEIPNLQKFINKKILVVTTKNKKFTGVLRGHDAFMNLVLVGEENVEFVVIRGDNITNVELCED